MDPTSRTPIPQPVDPHAPDDQRRNLGPLVAVLGAVAVVLVLVAGALAVLRPGRAETVPVDTATASAATEAPSATTDPGASAPAVSLPLVVDAGTGAGASASGGSVSSGGAPGASAPKAPAPPAPKPTAPAAVITSFSTPGSIDCHNGNSQSFTISWATKNTTKVTISVDGPGVYKTYGPTGSDSLFFDCQTSHSYLLTAYGQDGKTVTKSVTIQPRNVQKPMPGDEQE